MTVFHIMETQCMLLYIGYLFKAKIRTVYARIQGGGGGGETGGPDTPKNSQKYRVS